MTSLRLVCRCAPGACTLQVAVCSAVTSTRVPSFRLHAKVVCQEASTGFPLSIFGFLSALVSDSLSLSLSFSLSLSLSLSLSPFIC